MVESAVNVLGLWEVVLMLEVLSMFQDMVESGVIVSGYCRSAVSFNSAAIISGYGRK